MLQCPEDLSNPCLARMRRNQDVLDVSREAQHLASFPDSRTQCRWHTWFWEELPAEQTLVAILDSRWTQDKLTLIFVAPLTDFSNELAISNGSLLARQLRQQERSTRLLPVRFEGQHGFWDYRGAVEMTSSESIVLHSVSGWDSLELRWAA